MTGVFKTWNSAGRCRSARKRTSARVRRSLPHAFSEAPMHVAQHSAPMTLLGWFRWYTGVYLRTGCELPTARKRALAACREKHNAVSVASRPDMRIVERRV